jgi:hypothetical protein
MNEDDYVLPRVDNLIISVDTSRYKDWTSILSKEEVPLRKIAGLAHLDFGRLYPVEIRSTLEQLHKERMMPFFTIRMPNPLRQEAIANGVQVLLPGSDVEG